MQFEHEKVQRILLFVWRKSIFVRYDVRLKWERAEIHVKRFLILVSFYQRLFRSLPSFSFVCHSLVYSFFFPSLGYRRQNRHASLHLMSTTSIRSRPVALKCTAQPEHKSFHTIESDSFLVRFCFIFFSSFFFCVCPALNFIAFCASLCVWTFSYIRTLATDRNCIRSGFHFVLLNVFLAPFVSSTTRAT